MTSSPSFVGGYDDEVLYHPNLAIYWALSDHLLWPWQGLPFVDKIGVGEIFGSFPSEFPKSIP